jgi:hypothetical protein
MKVLNSYLSTLRTSNRGIFFHSMTISRGRSNYKLEDDSNLIEPEDPKIVYEWKVFHFPFTKVKLSLNTLK